MADFYREKEMERMRREIARSQDLNVAQSTQKEASEEKDQTAIQRGYQVLLEELKKRASNEMVLVDYEVGSLPLSSFVIDDKTLAALGNAKRDTTPIEISGYSADVLLVLYEIASSFLEEKKYDACKDACLFLTALTPAVSSFWVTLGLAHEASHKWDKAFAALEEATVVDPTDFDPYLVLLRCAEASSDFTQVVALLKKNRDNPAIGEEIEQALSTIPDMEKKGG